MKLPDSTEWVLHSVTTLALLDGEATASAGRLARYYDLPATYLAKQLQLLVRAGILTATTGPRGGFRLARPADRITMLEVVEAVDGGSAPYVCRELRQRGPGGLPAKDCVRTCSLAVRMADAHQAWRDSLAGVTIGDIVAELPRAVAPHARTVIAGL